MIYMVSLLAFGFTLFWQPLLLGLLRQSSMVRPNYAGELIPVPAGLVMVAGLVSAFAVTAILFPPEVLVLGAVAGIVAMAFLGLVDDVMGSRHASGLRGHFKMLLRDHQLTTGAFKALGGGLVALFLSAGLSRGGVPGGGFWFGPGWGMYLSNLSINALIIALSANAINLLDLRPGRAVKGYLVGVVAVIIASRSLSHLEVTAPVMAAAIAYLPTDLRGRAMMGDTGSNLLGLSLGLAAAAGLPLGLRIGFLLLLVLFHLYTEKYSLTRTIEKVGFLRWIDQLGRPATSSPIPGSDTAAEIEAAHPLPADQRET